MGDELRLFVETTRFVAGGLRFVAGGSRHHVDGVRIVPEGSHAFGHVFPLLRARAWSFDDDGRCLPKVRVAWTPTRGPWATNRIPSSMT